MRTGLMPLIYPLLMSTMGFSYVELTAMLSVTRLIGGLMQGAWGGLSRRMAAKRIIGFDNVGSGVAMLLTGACQTYPELAGAVTFGQVVASPQHPVASAMITRWFDERRHGTTLAVHSQLGYVTTVLTPLVATVLLRAFGWRETLYLFSIPAFLVGLWTLLTLPNEVVTPEASSSGRTGFVRDLLAPLKNPGIRRIILARSVTSGGKGYGVLIVFVPLYLRSLHFSPESTGLLYTLFNAMSVFAPLVAGRLADRFNRSRLLTILLTASTVAGLAMAAGGYLNRWLFVSLLLAFGIIIYSCAPVEQALVAEVTAPEVRVASYGSFFAISAVAGAVWPVALGAAVQMGGFPTLFLILAASYLAGAVIYGRGVGTGAAPADIPGA